MIDQIKNNINSLNNANSNKTNVESRKTNTEVKKVNQSNSKPENNSSAVSKFREKIKDMANEPPIDKASTSRIKNAIANGTYPIDLNKIADALFDAYKEMKE